MITISHPPLAQAHFATVTTTSAANQEGADRGDGELVTDTVRGGGRGGRNGRDLK